MKLATAASICVRFSGESLPSWAGEAQIKTAQNTVASNNLTLRDKKRPFKIMDHLPIKSSIVGQLLQAIPHHCRVGTRLRGMPCPE
jgi:hypothetical protein